ncbi:hypothetical protein HDU98_006409 [Podochytrium sp. JEL0797]|nr:hypothetical protein HDU98_006409 [Podochytrium sp. JEL0797]
MRTVFLRIEKQDFMAISREARGLDTIVMDFFTSVPAFFGVEKSLLTRLCQRSIVRRFDSGQVILRAGDFCSNLYFIIKGKARALHMVTFIKVDGGEQTTGQFGGNSRRHKYSLAPGGVDPTLKLGPDDEIVRELATVLDLQNGMFFPPIRPSKIVLEQQQALAKLESKATGQARPGTQQRKPSAAPGLGDLSADMHALQVPFHFVAMEKTELCVVAVQDLHEILPITALNRIMENRSMTDIGTQEIEERYLSAQGWRDTENIGSKTLQIGNFSKDSSWSHPVTANKFKKSGEIMNDPFSHGRF